MGESPPRDVPVRHRDTRAAELLAEQALSPHSSAPDIPPCVTFDESLLEEGEPLAPGELQLNELTVESVQHTWVDGWAWARHTPLPRAVEEMGVGGDC